MRGCECRALEGNRYRRVGYRDSSDAWQEDTRRGASKWRHDEIDKIGLTEKTVVSLSTVAPPVLQSPRTK